MATSEPLVPTGLPQGSRQDVRAGMMNAGIPLSPPGVSGGSPDDQEFTSSTPVGGSVPPTGGGPLDLMEEAGPEAFQFIQAPGAEPTPPPSAPRSVVSALAESSQSEFGRAVAMRLRQNSRR